MPEKEDILKKKQAKNFKELQIVLKSLPQSAVAEIIGIHRVNVTQWLERKRIPQKHMHIINVIKQELKSARKKR